MPDRVVGTAVMDCSKLPRELHVICLRAEAKTTMREVIQVYKKGEPKPCDPCWAYEIQGEWLSITPSLWIKVQADLPDQKRTTIFHNDGQWRVRWIAVNSSDEVYPALCRLNDGDNPEYAKECEDALK
jgi:hypothetical protein